MRILSRLWRSMTGGTDTAAPPRMPPPDELVPVTEADGEPEALFLKEMLESHGVHALVRNPIAPSAWGSLGTYEIVVMRRDLARAREVLDAYPADE